MNTAMNRRQALREMFAGAVSLTGLAAMTSPAAAQSFVTCPACAGSGGGNLYGGGPVCLKCLGAGKVLNQRGRSAAGPGGANDQTKVEVSWTIDEIIPEWGQRLNQLRQRLVGINQRRQRGDASANAEFFQVQQEYRNLELVLQQYRQKKTTVIVLRPGTPDLPWLPQPSAKEYVFKLVRGNPGMYHGQTFRFRTIR